MNLYNDDSKVFYVIKVNGVPVSGVFENATIAEFEKTKLPSETQELAEVVAVTKDGKQVLFG